MARPPRLPKLKMASPMRMGGGYGNKNALGSHGKYSQQEMLPSRHAMATLTGGSPEDRTLNNYAKLTPSGAGAAKSYDDIMDMGLRLPSINKI